MKRPSRETPTAPCRRNRRATAAAAGVAIGVLCCTFAPSPAGAASPSKKGKAPGVGLYKKAEASFAKKDYAATLSWLAKAEAAGGVSKADVMNLRGAVHLRRREFEKAREEFSSAASADRSLLAARYNLAEVDFEQGRYTDSRRRLQGLVGRAKGRNEKDFFQYKALLADLLDGKEESAVRYLSEHRGNPGKPSAEFCYLSAALAYRHGKPDEARRWAARVPRRAPRPVKRLFAASLEKFGPRLSTSDRGADSGVSASAETGGKLAKSPSGKPSFREGRSELDSEPTRGSGAESSAEASGGSTRNDEAAGGSAASEGSTTPAAVAMVQFVPEPRDSGANAASRTTSGASSSRPSSAAGASGGSAAPAKPRPENTTEDASRAAPKFRYGETSATDSDYLLAAASPTPKPTPSASGAGSKSAPASPSAAAAAAKPTPAPVSTPEPPTEAFNQKYEAAFIAFSKRDYTGALQSLKEADAIQPGQADPANLRGLIYARQRQFEQAEVEFKRAVQLDPTFWAAKFNLADLPFTYRNYGLARSRFETLLADIDPAALPREVELTQFKIFLTLLLEGKDASARAFMSRFKFEGTTPARLYAQAALDFHEGNFERAVSWMESAKKQFPPQLEALFAESFFRIGWLTNTPGLAQADPATGGSPSPSPSSVPTPGLSLAQAPNLPVPPPILETGENPTTSSTATLSLAPAATPAPSAAPTETPVVAAAAATPVATPSPTPAPSPVLVAQTSPVPTSPEATPASSPTAAPTAARIAAEATPAASPTATARVESAQEAPEQTGVDRLVRVILPAFVALYVLFTPFFILGAVLLRKKRSRKSRQIKVPLAYPSGKLARESKGESTS